MNHPQTDHYQDKAMNDKKIDNTRPMSILRQKKRDAGLVPKEIWVHKSVPNEKVKAAEKRLQVPVKTS